MRSAPWTCTARTRPRRARARAGRARRSARRSRRRARRVPSGSANRTRRTPSPSRSHATLSGTSRSIARRPVDRGRRRRRRHAPRRHVEPRRLGRRRGVVRLRDEAVPVPHAGARARGLGADQPPVGARARGLADGEVPAVDPRAPRRPRPRRASGRARARSAGSSSPICHSQRHGDRRPARARTPRRARSPATGSNGERCSVSTRIRVARAEGPVPRSDVAAAVESLPRSSVPSAELDRRGSGTSRGTTAAASRRSPRRPTRARCSGCEQVVRAPARAGRRSAGAWTATQPAAAAGAARGRPRPRGPAEQAGEQRPLAAAEERVGEEAVHAAVDVEVAARARRASRRPIGVAGVDDAERRDARRPETRVDGVGAEPLDQVPRRRTPRPAGGRSSARSTASAAARLRRPRVGRGRRRVGGRGSPAAMQPSVETCTLLGVLLPPVVAGRSHDASR